VEAYKRAAAGPAAPVGVVSGRGVTPWSADPQGSVIVAICHARSVEVDVVRGATRAAGGGETVSGRVLRAVEATLVLGHAAMLRCDVGDSGVDARSRRRRRHLATMVCLQHRARLFQLQTWLYA